MKAREVILNANDLQLSGPVAIPEWNNVEVFYSLMNSEERSGYENLMMSVDGQQMPKHAKETLLQKCLVNQDGGKIFAESDIKLIALKSSTVIHRIFMELMKLHGMTVESLEKQEKNSESVNTGGSN